VHISRADLMRLDGSSALMDEWTAQVRVAWAAHRAEASVSGSDSGAWLDGQDADAITCDAAMTPVVTGEVNPGALEDLVRLCVQLDRLRHPGRHPPRGHPARPALPVPHPARVAIPGPAGPCAVRAGRTTGGRRSGQAGRVPGAER
jgi:hypothetical protein